MYITKYNHIFYNNIFVNSNINDQVFLFKKQFHVYYIEICALYIRFYYNN